MPVTASVSGFQRSGAYTLDWLIMYDDIAKTVTVAATSRPDGNVKVCDMVVTLSTNATRTFNLINLDAATATAFGLPTGSSLLNRGEMLATGQILKLGTDKRATKIPSVSVRFQP